MRKIFILLSVVFFTGMSAYATHQRAGEITYRYLSPLTYEVTIVTYSYAPSLADRFELEISWGDGTTSILDRANGPLNLNGKRLGEIVGQDLKKNLYVGTHTYAGASTYLLSVEDPNRNQGVLNIPNSVEVPLYIVSELRINPFIGINSSPSLLLPPIDVGCVGQPYLHNPGAFDPDGDSLSFKLTSCRGAGGEFIPGFQNPNLIGNNIGGSFIMSPTTGELVWDKPNMQGEYNIAFLIEEWRDGNRIGFITRDMQINITTCTNNPPKLKPIMDTCIEAGKTLTFPIIATDMDGDRISLTATGSPFMIANPAVFFSPDDSAVQNTGYFSWNTNCTHVSKNSYLVYFKAVDNDPYVNLFDLTTVGIKVVGPAPKNLSAAAQGNSIRLAWNENACDNIAGYKIYRRNGFYGYIPSYCETGVPSYTGYTLIQTIGKDTVYLDSDVSRGIDYCYMVVALYPDGAESFASNEACAQLKKDLPVITHVSVLQTSLNSGEIFLGWSKPTEIDIQQAPGPYIYKIYRATGISGNDYVAVDSLFSLNDTAYIDKQLNTLENAYRYRVDLINNTSGNRFLLGPSQPASSVFIRFTPGDKKLVINSDFNVPWSNELFTIYQKNSISSQFDSIGVTNDKVYTVNNLINGNEYCFYVRTKGSYRTVSITDPLINLSQQACGIPIDNEAPCRPQIEVVTDCDNLLNTISISVIDPECVSDIFQTYIYYSAAVNEGFVLIDSTSNNTYVHDNLQSIIGCYTVRSQDFVGNLSAFSDTVCIDSDVCGRYRLPNLFTPNGDERNDMLKPFPYTSVQKVNMLIVNRWGQPVFKTDDPDIRWNGKILDTNQDAADGVYFYTCDVFEITLTGIRVRTLKGSVTIMRSQ